MNKEERIKRFKSMSSSERIILILKKMKEKGLEIGSGIPNKKYDNKEVYELIHILNCFPELREKKYMGLLYEAIYISFLDVEIFNPPLIQRGLSTDL